MLKELKEELKFRFQKKNYPFRPVFLIGCGRSGTTITGTTLGKHPSITYLNERRDLWHQAYPEFDIWSGQFKGPKLIATASDNDKTKTELLMKLLHKEQVLNSGSVLLEKLPINNFRLEFIQKAFPQAKYIYLHRNGIEVAKSIEQKTLTKKWFGQDSAKWQLLKKLSDSLDISNENLTNYEKALLEWRFSLQFSEAFFSKLNTSNFYSLSYQSFLENPKQQIENIYTFLGLDFAESLTTSLTKDIKRQSQRVERFSEREFELAGPNLKSSMENTLRQTAPNT